MDESNLLGFVTLILKRLEAAAFNLPVQPILLLNARLPLRFRQSELRAIGSSRPLLFRARTRLARLPQIDDVGHDYSYLFHAAANSVSMAA